MQKKLMICLALALFSVISVNCQDEYDNDNDSNDADDDSNDADDDSNDADDDSNDADDDSNDADADSADSGDAESDSNDSADFDKESVRSERQISCRRSSCGQNLHCPGRCAISAEPCGRDRVQTTCCC